MNVTEVMVKNVKSCGPDTNLEAAAKLMWDNDCGSIPVVDDMGTPIGIITDRDIAMSSALNHKPLWDITTRDVMQNRPVYTCKAGDNIKSALKMMQSHHVRRLPVTNGSGQLEGVLSIDDIISRAEQGATGGVSYSDTFNTLKAVCKHH